MLEESREELIAKAHVLLRKLAQVEMPMELVCHCHSCGYEGTNRYGGGNGAQAYQAGRQLLTLEHERTHRTSPCGPDDLDFFERRFSLPL